MRRLYVAVALCAAFLLPAAAAFAEPPTRPNDGHHDTRDLEAKAAVAGRLAAKARFAPLGARLAGAASVSGAVYDSNHNPWGSTPVAWWSWSASEQQWYSGEGLTAADGTFAWNNVTPTTWGEIWAYPDEGTTFARSGETWSDAGSYSRTLYPGRVAVVAHRGGRWGDFSSVVVRFNGPTRYSRGTVTAADASTTPVSDTIDVLDGNYSSGSAEFFWDEGIEFYGSVGVAPGADAGTLTVNEADAQRVWFSSPRWYSGKPGATVTVAMDNFPAGWINRVTGYTDDPAGTASKTFGTWTSGGTQTQTLRVKVPSTAKPGYAYWIGFQHVDGSGNDQPLYLEEIYQVATMKASKTAIRRGARIRLRGVVPTQGHWGSQAGIRKVVTVYAHKGRAKVPTKWNPASQGWFKLGTVRTNGLGAYTTPYFKPPSTHTLVVRYPGDNWYLDAYTSVQKITVR